MKTNQDLKKVPHYTSLRKNNQELSHSEQTPWSSTSKMYLRNIYVNTIHLHCCMQ